MAIQLKVGLDSNSKLGIELQGDENDLFALLGALDYAKDALIDRIKQRNGALAWASPFPPPPKNQAPPATSIPIVSEDMYSSEQKVPRDKAIEATEYAIHALQLRIEKMKSSPAEATFVIDPSLLAQL